MLRIRIASLEIEVSNPASSAALREILGGVVAPALPSTVESLPQITGEPTPQLIEAGDPEPAQPKRRAARKKRAASKPTKKQPAKRSAKKQTAKPSRGSRGRASKKEERHAAIRGHLEEHGPLRASQLAVALKIPLGSITAILRDDRYIKRDDNRIWLAGVPLALEEGDEAEAEEEGDEEAVEYEYEYEEESEEESAEDPVDQVASTPAAEWQEAEGVELEDASVLRVARRLRRIGFKAVTLLAIDLDMTANELRGVLTHEWFSDQNNIARLSEAGRIAMGVATDGIS